ncbi:hypothetical protein MEQU1_001053 [Malassezia equina]|uniref:Trimethylguanosine synthase n=1 Tax=Malassezia equina TaxID=1381935 RepID=A0AAF0EDE6_9BASI|nr:hypothetical protein MEQU1_001053 [Malassezia equina]
MLADTVQGNDYFEKFNFFTGNDLQLTQGLVNYVDLQTAKNTNLSYVDGNNFVMRVDTTQVQEQGRPSVRIESKQSYTDAVIVLQVSHIPTGCAVWPAFWTVTKNQQAWPAGGEIDIIENVNDQYPYNLGSAHVQQGDCAITNPKQTGTTVFDQCNAVANDNSGCRIAMNGTQTATGGVALNQQGGGTVALQRDLSEGGQGIRMWFWGPNNLPSDLKNPGNSVDPTSWGTPAADLGLTQCSDKFDDHVIVFDITLCGSWAGAVYDQTSCASKYPGCGAQVGQYGDSFKDAYWEVQNFPEEEETLWNLNEYSLLQEPAALPAQSLTLHTQVMDIQPGIIPSASGSALLESVMVHVKFVDPGKETELSGPASLVQQALLPALRLELLPKSSIDVHITVLDSDTSLLGLVAMGVSAASTALAQAGIEMLGMVMGSSAVKDISDILVTKEEARRMALKVAIRHRSQMPENMHKYWRFRESLFSRFNEGILMDEESCVFMSPPWGGVDYMTPSKIGSEKVPHPKYSNAYPLSALRPCGGFALFDISITFADMVVMFLPRNTDLDQIAQIVSRDKTKKYSAHVEEMWMGTKLKALCVYLTKEQPLAKSHGASKE